MREVLEAFPAQHELVHKEFFVLVVLIVLVILVPLDQHLIVELPVHQFIDLLVVPGSALKQNHRNYLLDLCAFHI